MLAGAVLGIGGELWRERTRDRRAVEAFIQAVGDEIDALWTNYHENMGRRVEALADGEGLPYYYPLSQQYFTVYESNAHLLAGIADDDLRRRIVRVYSLARSLLEVFHMNTWFFRRWQEADFLTRSVPSKAHARRLAADLKQLNDYGRVIKAVHLQVKAEVEALSRVLDERQRVGEGR